MELSKKLLILSVVIIAITFSGCKEKDPTLKEYSDYYNAVLYGDIETVKKSLRRHPQLVNWEFDFAGYQGDGLITAILGDNLDVFKLLLEKGANPNYYASDGVTPLMVAIEQSKNEFIEELLIWDARIDIATNEQNTALHFIAKNGDVSLAEIIIPNEYNIESENIYGYTPLSYALVEYNNEMILYLVGLGANLTYALEVMPHIIPEYVMNNNKEMLDYFWEKDLIDPYDVYQGYNLFHYAVWQNNPDFVKSLLDRNLWDYSETSEGETPFDMAVRLERQEIIDLLNDAGIEQ